MASTRTTLVLDDKARDAARQLARRYGCSLSEATRRALVRQRDAELGVPRKRRDSASRRCDGCSPSSRATIRASKSGG